VKLKQKEKVLRHLREFGSITPMEAIREYGIMRLGARIFDLKADGYAVETTIVHDKNRFGEPTHYARYTLL